jgi:hypothetical protein
MTRKVGESKNALKSGFSEALPIFEESEECLKLVDKSNLILKEKEQLENKAQTDRDLAEEKEREKELRERAKQEEESRAKDQKRKKDFEALYE